MTHNAVMTRGDAATSEELSSARFVIYVTDQVSSKEDSDCPQLRTLVVDDNPEREGATPDTPPGRDVI